MTDFGKEPIGASIITQVNEKAQKARDARRDTLFMEKLSEGQPPDAVIGEVWAGRNDEVEALWQEAEREADQWIAAQLARD